MNENLGIIGQKYEDRKTGKTGTLVRRDESANTLIMKAFGGSEFIVSCGAFRSNWRKAKDNITAVSKEENEVMEKKVVNGMSVDAFIERVSEVRPIRVAQASQGPVELEIYLRDNEGEEIKVVQIDEVDGGYDVQMTADIYIHTNMGKYTKFVDISASRELFVLCKTTYTSIDEVLDALFDAVCSANLYVDIAVENEEEDS